ncbi:hypothetical protein niasHT_024923 [Heterodera trifolii]|uniref:Effector protein n=1 Tax=Heterodera trifolii TaxID=157864 RepID=A0ABD2KPM8_9BILA
MLFTWVLFLSCVPLLLHSELINVDLTVDNQNYFDSGKYCTFSKDATAQHFGYSWNTACRIEKCERDNEWAVSLQNVYTLHSYQSVFLNEIIENLVRRLSSVVTSRRLCNDCPNMDGLCLITYRVRLFLIDKHQRRISEIELEYLEHWWLRKNQSSAYTILKSNFVAFLPTR